MANANITLIQTANTFDDWRIATNNLANSVNELRNGNYYKDGGNLTVPAGILSLTQTTGTTLSVVANALISGLTTMNTTITTGNASLFGNLTLTGLNSLASFGNVVSAPYIQANSSLSVNGYLLITGSNVGNAPLQASIAGNAIVNIANNIFISNTGNTELKGNLILSGQGNALNVVNNAIISGNLVVSKNTTVTLNANVGGTFNVVGAAAFTTSNTTTGNVVTLNVSTGNINSIVAIAEIVANSNVANLNAVSAIIGTANINVLNTSSLAIRTSAEIDLLYLDPTHTYSITNGNAIFNNVTIQGTTTTVGNSVSASDTLILRNGLATAGDGHLTIIQGTTNGNADLKFFAASNVWQVAANVANGYSTLISVANLTDSVVSTSITNAAAANAAKTAYDRGTSALVAANAAGNTVMISQNGASTLNNKFLNFVNTANVTIVVTDKGDGNANIAILSSAGQPPGGALTQIQFNDTGSTFNGSANLTFTKATNALALTQGELSINTVPIGFTMNAAYAQANSARTTANAALPAAGGTMTGNIAMANNVISSPTFSSARETVNTITVSASTFTANLAGNTVFDITLQNANVAITFNNAALSGNLQAVTLILRQPSTTGNGFSIANTVKWSNAEIPVLASGIANKFDMITFFTVDGGTTFAGAHGMANVG